MSVSSPFAQRDVAGRAGERPPFGVLGDHLLLRRVAAIGALDVGGLNSVGPRHHHRAILGVQPGECGRVKDENGGIIGRMARSPLKRRKALAFVALLSVWASLTMHAPQAQPLNAEPVAWMLFVDDLHLRFANTGRLRTLVRTVLDDVVEAGDLVAIRTSGPLPVLTDFGRSGDLLPLVKGLSGNGLRPSDIIAGASSGREVRYRMRMSLSLATSAMALLGQAGSSRRGLIYISDGYPLDVSALVEGRALAETAANNGVRVFAVDGRSLDDHTGAPAVADPAWNEYLTATQASLRVIAEQSGGSAIFDGDDLPAALQRISTSMRQ
jgi:hypothetical protein